MLVLCCYLVCVYFGVLVLMCLCDCVWLCVLCYVVVSCCLVWFAYFEMVMKKKGRTRFLQPDLGLKSLFPTFCFIFTEVC